MGEAISSRNGTLCGFVGISVLSHLNPPRNDMFLGYPFLNELKSLLEKALSFYPAAEQEQLVMNRRRPRSMGKVL
ncbi:MAG TPA: hypothetical protein VFR47_25275 [Anaerolineales bacterium]|nr:hypothetical protein [Anaerolineales bacterium]